LTLSERRTTVRRGKTNGSIRKDPRGYGWQARWRDPVGIMPRRSYTRSFRTKDEAEEFLSEQKRAMRRHSYQRRSREHMPTLCEWGNALIDRGWVSNRKKRLTPATASYYRMVLDHLCPVPEGSARKDLAYPKIGVVPLDEITAEDLRRLDRVMTEAGRSDSTIHKVLQTIRAMLNAAVAEGLIRENPILQLPGEDPREIRPLTVAELDGLIAALKGDRDRVLASFLAASGLRFGEAAYLRRFHLDLVRAEVRVQGSATEVDGRMVEGKTKGKSSRIVPLDPDTAAVLEDFTKDMEIDTLVFAGPEGGYLRARSWRRRIWVPALKAAGLWDPDGKRTGHPTPRIHDLRHTAASLMFASGLNVIEVSKILGHANPTITLNRYMHLIPGTTPNVAQLAAYRQRERQRDEVTYEERGAAN
jgi:integrase